MSSSYKTISNKELQQEILRLATIYMQCIGWDHHKDRDCHFYINQKFEYGDGCVFYIEHPGYHNEYQDYEEYHTWREAAIALVELIRGYIADKLEYFSCAVVDKDNPFGYNEKEVNVMKKIYEDHKLEFNV